MGLKMLPPCVRATIKICAVEATSLAGPDALGCRVPFLMVDRNAVQPHGIRVLATGEIRRVCSGLEVPDEWRRNPRRTAARARPRGSR